MKRTEFNSVAVSLFGEVLGPFGFTSKRSRHCTFYRKKSEEVYHFVAPSIGTSGTWYDVHVFPHSPFLDPRFEFQYPDELGIPSDSWSCLSEHDGVNLTQQQFNCKSEENFRSSFSRKVRPLLLEVAIPYLDRFQTVSDIIPFIRHPSFLGFALHHVGRIEESRVALEKERIRLKQLDTTDESVSALLDNVEKLLQQA